MDFGRRLLPSVVDHLAKTEPSRVYASFPRSPTSLSDGFQDVTMAKLSSMVDSLSWWLQGFQNVGNLNVVAYIGPADIRYAVVFLAVVKCKSQVLFISPRNLIAQNRDMLLATNCRLLLHAEDSSTVAHSLNEELSHISVAVVPSLGELLKTADDLRPFPYERKFDEMRDEPCLILHSSGSTGMSSLCDHTWVPSNRPFRSGNPKLVTMTHGTFAVTDNDRNMPVPPGRKAQNASMFDFERGGRFYSCFPAYHLAGVQSYIALPIFATAATVVLGPCALPPSGYLLSEIFNYQQLRAFYVPPFMIEQWFLEPGSIQQAKQIEFVLYGGGPLSPRVGDQLSQMTDVCQMYGSMEIGQVQLLVPRNGQWSYMELNPFEEADMQPSGSDDGTFEMVLHQHPKFATRRSLWHNFPGIKTWRTGDLFVPHPHNPQLWRFHSRLDDLIVLSTGHKLRPVRMESIIQGHAQLAGTLIAGQSQPEPVLIVEPKPGEYDGKSPAQFIDSIWSSVEDANTVAPSYAQINRSRVIIADPAKPFLRAPKGSVVRKLTEKAYQDEINAAYNIESVQSSTQNLDVFMQSALKQFLRKCVEEQLPGTELADTDDFFVQGLDSLAAARLNHVLQQRTASLFQLEGGFPMFFRAIYSYPTLEKLTPVVFASLQRRDRRDRLVAKESTHMERTVQGFTENLPPSTANASSIGAGEGAHVAILGPRGSLGPQILKHVLASPEVKKVYCLSRGEHGREKMRTILANRDLSGIVEDERVMFMSIDLQKPGLGLSKADYKELAENVDIIIHNAWRVDFNWTLDMYKHEYLRSIRELVDLSAQSQRRPRVVLVSSIASVQDWAAVFPETPVTELPLESWDVTSPLGYGQSKHVAERILCQSCAVSGTPVTILRVGQVAGPTATASGKWSPDEWIPSLTAISKLANMIPNDMPPIDWIPVDLAAQAICELSWAFLGKMDSSQDVKIFNLVNPKLTAWSVFVKRFQTKLSPGAKQVTLAEWVDYLRQMDLHTLPREIADSVVKLLPFFQHLAELAARGAALQPRFDTTQATQYSETMKQMGPIDEHLLDLWFQ